MVPNGYGIENEFDCIRRVHSHKALSHASLPGSIHCTGIHIREQKRYYVV